MAKITLFPLGNADSTLFHLADDRLILKDYFKVDTPEDGDKRIDLEQELRAYLEAEKRNDFDVTAFSHCDDDHCHGAENFFWFDYATTYQGNNRIKMKQIWVPACFIFETGLKGAARVVQREACYRFEKGYGVRVFGNPGPLEDWLRGRGIDPAQRQRFISKAGACIPGFTRNSRTGRDFSPFSVLISYGR